MTFHLNTDTCDRCGRYVFWAPMREECRCKEGPRKDKPEVKEPKPAPPPAK